MKEFEKYLTMGLTQNELSIITEAAADPFTRNDLLVTKVTRPGTYEPSALTRTIKKLECKGLIISSHINGTTFYCLNGPSISLGKYENLALLLARSHMLTLNTLRVALELIALDNQLTSVRYLAGKLKADPLYLAEHVLPRMVVLGLILTGPLSKNDLVTSEDETIIDAQRESLIGFCLNTTWTDNINTRWV